MAQLGSGEADPGLWGEEAVPALSEVEQDMFWFTGGVFAVSLLSVTVLELPPDEATDDGRAAVEVTEDRNIEDVFTEPPVQVPDADNVADLKETEFLVEVEGSEVLFFE